MYDNLFDLKNLKRIGDFAFQKNDPNQFDFSAMPDSIETLNQCAFKSCVKENSSIILPENLKTLGAQVFSAESRLFLKDLYIPDSYSTAVFPVQAFMFLTFDCDFRLPPLVTEMAQQSLYRASFKNVTIPATCTKLGNQVFYAPTTDSVDGYNMETITFEGETPPTFGLYLFSDIYLNNGLKIYVPDNSLEAYKAATNFSKYANYIYPMSQKS